MHKNRSGLAERDRFLHGFCWLRDRALVVAFAMLATAFLAVLSWDRLRLDARDLRVLGPLPLARRTLAVCKALAVLQFLGLFALAVNLFTATVIRAGLDVAWPNDGSKSPRWHFGLGVTF